MSEEQQQLMIPNKIKIGFQNREGTYTGKLAYVIYYDNKGVLRKEKSWESWRDDKIAAVEFENTPMEGFVLNKKVGGYKSDWNYRSAHIRVYDPRDFEFEISVENLLFILRECDCSRGKGLEGKFVYSWQGTELVLLPEQSSDYKNSKNFTELQNCKVKAKDLILGASYQTKRQEIYIYLGKLIKHCVNDIGCSWNKEVTGPRQIFWDVKNKIYIFLTSLTSIAILHSDVISPDYAELVDAYNKSVWGSKPIKLFTKKNRKKIEKGYTYGNYWAHEETPGTFFQCTSQYERNYNAITRQYDFSENPTSIHVESKLYILDDILYSERVSKTAYKDPKTTASERSRIRSYRYTNYTEQYLDTYFEPTKNDLWVELESGSKFKLTTNSLIEPKTKKEEDEDGDED